jgi:hypothetical protein
VSRPRTADDFAAIRARLEELQRDRTRAWAAKDPSADSLPSTAVSKPSSADEPGLSPRVRRVLYGPLRQG